MKNRKYPIVGTVLKTNRKIIERDKLGTHNTQINLIIVDKLQFDDCSQG